jgi:hypothetical protein
MKENKLNVADCGSNLAITEGGLVAKHSGPTGKNKIVLFLMYLIIFFRKQFRPCQSVNSNFHFECHQ